MPDQVKVCQATSKAKDLGNKLFCETNILLKIVVNIELQHKHDLMHCHLASLVNLHIYFEL